MKAARSAAALTLLLLLLAGCGSPAAEPEGAPPPATGAPADPTDAAWAQLMTPMNESAVALLSLASDRSGDTGVRRWAAGLRTSQNGELARLRPLLARMGLPDTNVHEGHRMPGMVTADDLARARTLRGAAFDRFLVDRIGGHLRQTAQVSRSETGAGTRPDAKRLAADLFSARRTEIARLPALPGAPG
ncbi:DUF305 domain-containing protein [Streptomyces sp. SID9727]|uniref:DUF305 domain-containing protein n=1 Tax=Streptomyces sp. SID9727 TaxID=2706114 RepID=UPI0013C8120F|nr:DUF305 domain-containing protein [Streptomyces sp. SID9727]NEC69959.1 DUF305 domain-containing protein [Streptomyces sp. SID9727]